MLDFSNIKERKNEKNFLKQLLDSFSQIIDYEFEEEKFKIVIYRKNFGLAISDKVKKIDVRYFLGLFRYNIELERGGICLI